MRKGDRVQIRVPYEVDQVGDLQELVNEIAELGDTHDGVPIADEIFWIRKWRKDGLSDPEVIGRLTNGTVPLPLDKALRYLERAKEPPGER